MFGVSDNEYASLVTPSRFSCRPGSLPHPNTQQYRPPTTPPASQDLYVGLVDGMGWLGFEARGKGGVGGRWGWLDDNVMRVLGH